MTSVLGLLIFLVGCGVQPGGNLAPYVIAGPNQTVDVAGSADLSGIVVDDDFPSGSLTVTWEQLAGPGPVTFENANAAATRASFQDPGEYRLQLSASDGELTTYDELLLVVVDAEVEADFFVAPDGSDGNDGRSVDRPFRTIRKAASVVRPGDLVYLRGGVYREYNQADVWVTSGEPGAPITFSGYPGETVVLDGSDRHWSETPGNPSSPELIRLRDVDWYVFVDLTLVNSAGRGLALEGDHHEVRNVVSRDHHGDGIFVRGSHNLIEDSVSSGNFSESNGGESADGIKISSGEGNIIRYFVAHHNSDDGVDIWDSTNTLVEHSVAYENGSGSTGDGQGFKMSNGDRADSGSIIRFNVSYANRSFNFTDNGGGGLTVHNNTSWDAGSFGFVVRGRTGKAVSLVFNNISFADGEGVLIDVQESGAQAPDAHHNSWDLSISNPRFVSTDPAGPRFLDLADDSPAVDAGVDAGHPFAGFAPDLGARELGLATRNQVLNALRERERRASRR